jgi:hypothetical protein
LKEQATELTTNEQQSFVGLIQLLSVSAYNILGESTSRVHFAEMLEELLEVLSPLMLPATMCQFLLDLQLRILQHEDLDASHYAVRFWTSFYLQLRKPEKKNLLVDNRLLLEYYAKVYEQAR